METATVVESLQPPAGRSSNMRATSVHVQTVDTKKDND
jgi:hypothetical protein